MVIYQHHPEQKEGEIYLGNVWAEDAKTYPQWKTTRLGQNAFDREGKPLKDHRPAFISVAEVQAEIERRPEVAKYLQPMIDKGTIIF